MDNDQLPTSIEEIEALIKQLYGIRVAEDIKKIQEILHKLQLSPQGWHMANALLNRNDDQVKFFGALTFIVKLNTDAKTLSEDDAQSLLVALIGSLIKWTESGQGPLVGRKLCSVLVAYFLQFPSSWSNCVKHLLYCFCSNEALPYSALDESLDSGILILNITERKAQTVFWFASALVEDLSKMDSNSMKANNFHRCVRPNVDVIVPLIGKYLCKEPSPIIIEVQQAALSCFQSWVSFSHRSFIDKEADLEALHLLTQPALRCITNDVLYETSVELFTDILSSYSRFLRQEDFDSLHSLFNSSWAQKKYEALVEGDYEWDSLQFGQLLLAIGDATQKELALNIDDPLSTHYLSLFIGLLNAKGYAFSEDKIYVSALEFWSTFVEVMVDESFSIESASVPSWFPTAQHYVMQAIENCWRKSLFPPPHVFNSWDAVDSTGFKDARRDLSDLIQQFYLVSRPTLLQFWIEKISYSAATRKWPELEASLYCLAQLSDSVSETSSRNNALDQVFTPELINLFVDPHLEISTRTRRAFLNLIIGYASYFKERPQLIPNVLNLSFVALTSPGLVLQASRTITKLFSNCRQSLLPNLSGFLQHYSNIAPNSALDSEVKGSIIEGVSCLIQALDSEVSKIAPLNQLLGYIEADVEKCLRLVLAQNDIIETHDKSTGIDNEDEAAEIGISVLKCLSGVARGLQASDDRSINLDSENEVDSSIWSKEEGLCVQQKIYDIICRVFDALRHRGDVVEECCSLWRHGLREIELGPFALSPNLIAEFMMKADITTPRLGLIIKTATYLTSSKYSTHAREFLNPLLTWLTNMLLILNDPGADSEISHAGIEFIHRLLPGNIDVLLSFQPPASLEFLFMFALKAIEGTEPLPKSAAADFWNTFISLDSLPSDIQSSLNSAVQILGPLLTKALIFSVGGNAARSELDKLSGPIKKLTTCQVNAKQWFGAALTDPNFPSKRVDSKDKALFLEKIMNLRGARVTNQVVRDFWLSCRGSNFAYVS
ncbi:Importin beta-like protein [Golovinomyces cichoracearum]|uniref:Importin beta-like protein n=1 Tax=Golovinomyces cichoracearum TaxID=62708 RepID=A0A420IDQ8_9PEZI|nr:Importin beta-like protein [Golovinomyces cichoracearum]